MIEDIKKFRFWCQKVIPLVYDNSLSYYEVLCKVVDYLNKVIEDINEIPSYIDAKVEEALDDEHIKELLEQFIADIEAAISSNNEGDNTNSSADYNIGQMLWWNGKLYKVIRQIDAGDTFIVDTNIELVNFEDLFNDFVDEVKHDITANDDGGNTTASQGWEAGTWLWLNDVLYEVVSDIAEGNAYILTGENANVKQITIDSKFDEIIAKIGDLSELNTEAKNNLVSAINELYLNIENISSVKVFNTVEELRSTELEAGDLARTLGYYTAYDGGGLTFFVVDNSEIGLTDNGGNIIVVGDNACVNFDKVYNVKAFGATTDGDASDAINKAIEVGDEIIIDSDYECDDSIVIKSNKVIHGGGSITLSVDLDNVSVQRFNTSIIDVYDCKNTTIKDLSITFNVVNYGSMFRLENCKNLVFDGLNLSFNGTATSVSINAMFDLHNNNKYITVQNCNCILTNDYSTHGGFMWVQYSNVSETGVERKDSNHIVVRNNTISSSAHDEILAVYNYYTNETAVISDVDIKNNTFIRPAGSNEMFMLTIFSGTDYGVKNVNVDGNHFIAETTTANNQMRVIAIDAGSQHTAIVEGITITNNTFEGDLSASGIIDSPYGPVGSRVIITNNVIKNTGDNNTTYPAFYLYNMTAIVNDNMVDGYDIIIRGNNVGNGFYVKNQTSTGMKNLYGDTDNGAIQFMNNDVFAWQTFNISAVNGASEVVEFTQTPVYWGLPAGRPIACWATVNNNMVVRVALGSYKKITVFNFSASGGSVKIFVYIPQAI